MGERGIDRVKIALSRQTVTIPWESRNALVERLRPLESMREVVGTFWGAGTSRPLILTPEQQVALLDVISVWSQEVTGGLAGLPDGIDELRNALVDESAALQSD